jgi:Protein of unknown function (DUF4435)
MIHSISRTPGSIVAEIEMLRAAQSLNFLIVEGPSDKQFWAHWFESSVTHIVIAGGKSPALLASDLLDQRGDRTVLTIVDADFDRAEMSKSCSTRVVTTDAHDLDTYLALSLAFDRAMLEVAPSFSTAKHHEFRDCAITLAKPFGQLRHLNQTRKYSVDFKKLSPYKYVIENTELDVERVFADFSIQAGINKLVLDRSLPDMTELEHVDSIQGHDLLSCICIVLRGSGVCNISEKRLQSSLRLALDRDHIAQSAMFRNLSHKRSSYLED